MKIAGLSKFKKNLKNILKFVEFHNKKDLTKHTSNDTITQHSLLARVAELADAPDLKSVGLILRAGSSPATSTSNTVSDICRINQLRQS